MTVIQKRTHHGPVEGRLSFIQENTLVTPFAGIEYAACVATETSNGSKNHRGKLAKVQRNMERNPQRLKDTCEDTCNSSKKHDKKAANNSRDMVSNRVV